MKTATVRDLRNHFPRVAAWIEEGEPTNFASRFAFKPGGIPAIRAKA
jgi:hypothetical protein